MKNLKAFTLAEILITVGIIGVISALTMPTLTKNYQKKANVVQFRKVVNEFENAVDMLITEEGKTSMASTSIGTVGFNDFIKTHFKTIKTCSSSNTSGCFASDTYLSIDGSESKTFKCSGDSYILANSAAVCANKVTQVSMKVKKSGYKDEEDAYQKVTGLNIELYIDTNGADGPNIGGRDMFHVYIRPDGRIYDTAVTDGWTCQGSSDLDSVCLAPDSYSIETADCTASAFGDGCFALLLNNNWVMDY